MPKNDKYLLQIKTIIGKYLDLNQYKLFLFGSRASGNAAKFADYDIGIQGQEKVPRQILFQIKGDLEESDLPVFVDVIDFNEATDKFKEVALMKTVKM